MKLFLFTLVLLLSGTEALAMNDGSLRTKVICEEGYKFLVVWSSQGASPTVTQIMQEGADEFHPMQPMTCDK